MQRENQNPIKVLERVWSILETVTLTGSVLLVIGTVGYLSVLKLV
jgi:hypothetical protein